MHHLAAYAFFPLSNPTLAKSRLQPLCDRLDLKGTVLLAPEGINLYVTGVAQNVAILESTLNEELGVPALKKNLSECAQHAYQRMRIKIKKEIVTCGDPSVNPRQDSGPDLPPQELQYWFRSGKEFTLIDTRNAFEVALGRFQGAKSLNVANFREFTKQAQALPDNLKSRPLVMYCTGGIRCEKSSAQFLKQLGFSEVYKLQGGILNYLRECGGDYWEGECFVFDERIALNSNLQPTGTILCDRCQWPVTRAQQSRPEYHAGFCLNCRYTIFSTGG